MLYVAILLLILGDLLLLGYILNLIFNWDTTIIAGIISFIGSVFGGVITYFGVNKTLRHRDRELFLETATEKLILSDDLIQKHKKYLNSAFLYENEGNVGNMEPNAINKGVQNLLKEFYESLELRNKDFYKTMDYDDLKILMFHQKTMSFLVLKTNFNEEDRKDSIEKIRSVFNIFNVNKEKLEENYYKNKREM